MSGGQVLFSSETLQSTEEIGRFLVQSGEKLQREGFFTLLQGEEELKVAPAGSTKLELKYKAKGEKQQFEIEIEWRPGQKEVTVK